MPPFRQKFKKAFGRFAPKKRPSFAVKKPAFRKSARPVAKSKKVMSYQTRKWATSARSSFAPARRSQRKQLLNNMVASIPTHSFVFSYVDTVTTTGVTSAATIQGMWGARVASNQPLGAPVNNLVNCQLHPPELFNMIAAQQANTSLLNGVPTVAATTRILCRDLTTRTRITNLSTGACILTHYRCKARKDLNYTGANSINSIMANGFADAAAGTTGVGLTGPLALTTYGATPFMNPRFVSNVKVQKVKKYEIAPGKAIKLAFTTRKPRVLKLEDWQQGVAPNDGTATFNGVRQILKGQTFSVFQLQGTLATATGLGANAVGIGNTALGLIYEIKAHYSILSPSQVVTGGKVEVPGFTPQVDTYPLPMVQNQPVSAISTGPTPAAAGTRVYPTAGNDGFVVKDAQMVDA